MNGFRRIAAVLRESVAAAWAQPVASVVIVIMVAGMCASVLLTTGRTVGNEQSVLGSIDSAGTRSIVIRADSDSGLDTSVLERLSTIDGIAWAGAFSAATDVTNASLPGSMRVPIRIAYGAQFKALGATDSAAVPGGTAWASASALEQLGMPDAVGGVTTDVGEDYAVVGAFGIPDYLRFLEPLVIVPSEIQGTGANSPVGVLVIVAMTPELVAPVSDAAQSVLAVSDPTKVKITTSENLASLRALIEGQLGTFGRELVLVIFGLTAWLVAAILYGLVTMRRKDFGRRRALGASQRLIVTILLTQIALLSILGATAGSAAAAAVLIGSGDPLPSLKFFAGVAVLAVFVGLVAAAFPALSAARRDPLTELRVP